MKWNLQRMKSYSTQSLSSCRERQVSRVSGVITSLLGLALLLVGALVRGSLVLEVLLSSLVGIPILLGLVVFITWRLRHS